MIAEHWTGFPHAAPNETKLVLELVRKNWKKKNLQLEKNTNIKCQINIFEKFIWRQLENLGASCGSKIFTTNLLKKKKENINKMKINK